MGEHASSCLRSLVIPSESLWQWVAFQESISETVRSEQPQPSHQSEKDDKAETADYFRATHDESVGRQKPEPKPNTSMQDKTHQGDNSQQITFKKTSSTDTRGRKKFAIPASSTKSMSRALLEVPTDVLSNFIPPTLQEALWFPTNMEYLYTNGSKEKQQNMQK